MILWGDFIFKGILFGGSKIINGNIGGDGEFLLLLKYLNAVTKDQMKASLVQDANMDVFCVTDDSQVTVGLMF